MVFDINAGSQFGVNSKFFINPLTLNQSSPFNSGYLSSDVVDLKSDITRFVNPQAVNEMVNSSPVAVRMVQNMGIPLKINMQALKDLSNGHLQDTKNTVNGILNALPESKKWNIDRNSLLKAASLHDFGKVLIPETILNKNGSLTPKEKEIMDKHSELGAELLRSQNVDNKVLDLIKYHHQNLQGSGYPEIKSKNDIGIENQVLYAADVYSALREKRPYKLPMTKNQALSILNKDVKDGKLDKNVFAALVSYVNKNEMSSCKKAS